MTSAFADVQCEVLLVESGIGLVHPGESLRVFCLASEFIFIRYHELVPQAPRKSLEWVLYINSSGGTTSFANFLKALFTISRDKVKNELDLQINRLRTKDRAMHYCAGDTERRSQCEPR